MPASFKKLDNEPIVILTYYDPISPADLASVFAQTAKVADMIEPLYVINDLSAMRLTFGGVVMGTSEAARGGPGSAGDTRTRHVLVGGHELVKFSGEAMKQEQYGALNIPVFATIEEALAEIHADIRADIG